MVVTLADLKLEVGIENTTDRDAILSKKLLSAAPVIAKVAPDAPEAVGDEAVIRLASWLYQAGPGVGRERYQNALRQSGALVLLTPFLSRDGQVAG